VPAALSHRLRISILAVAEEVITKTQISAESGDADAGANHIIPTT
jgi:hypothetical protein